MIAFECKLEVKKHFVKKNGRMFLKNRKTGKMFLGKDKDLIEGEASLTEDLAYAYLQFCKKNKKDHKPITEWLIAEFVFLFPQSVWFTKKNTVSKNLPDLSNLYELPQDCLQKAGVIDDDWQINGHSTSRRGVSKVNKYELLITLRYA